MEEIVECLVKAGYYRACISNLSDFDKIIGGIAWAMQLSHYDRGIYDRGIDVSYKDSLDLGQKIALTERLVVALIALGCPYRIEPHQIVGLDCAKLLLAIRWLLKRSKGVRHEQRDFNRLLALSYYYKTTGALPDSRSRWHRAVVAALSAAESCSSGETGQAGEDSSRATDERRRARELLESIERNSTDLGGAPEDQQVSFLRLAGALQASGRASSESSSPEPHKSPLSVSLESIGSTEDKNQGQDVAATCFTDDDAKTTISDGDESYNEDEHKRLDLEFEATNQKILELSKRLDEIPGQLEVCQYQRRYIELHQQLMRKNKEVKKVFDLHNSLGLEKHYLEREVNLLESISENLHLTNDSAGNRKLFMNQLESIIKRIRSIRDDMDTRVVTLRWKCDLMNEEHLRLVEEME